jgi:predicted RNase H-like nuclease (RuvC/YqgF family)
MVESLEQTIEEQGDTIVALRSELRGFRDQQDVLNQTRRMYEALLDEHEELKRRLGDTLVARLMDEETP